MIGANETAQSNRPMRAAAGTRNENRLTLVLAWIWSSLQEIFLGPFRSDAAVARGLSVRALERRRRALVLQLILTVILLFLILIAVPWSLLNGEPLGFYALFLGLTLLAILGLVANRAGWTTPAASVFVAGAFAATVGYAASGGGGADGAVANYADLVVFILVAGLTLPSGLLWISTLVAAFLTAGGLVFFPFAVHPSIGAGGGGAIGLANQLIAYQILAALLTQVYANSSRASLAAAVRAYEQERELTTLKDQFLIGANHELRTPIMALSGNIQLLAKLGKQATEDDHERLLARAVRSATHLQQLLNNVLDAATLASGAPKVTLAPVEVGAVLYDTITRFDPEEVGEPGLAKRAMQARTVEMQVEPGLVAQADSARLGQILLNLVANAVKYSEPGTPLVISATRVKAESQRPTRQGQGKRAALDATEYIRVGVKDYGLGVPPSEAHILFQRFVRLPRDIAGQVRGTGVGLYLTRTLVEAMGGRIWVESLGVPGEGSTFYFTLPALGQSQPTMSSATPLASVRLDA